MSSYFSNNEHPGIAHYIIHAYDYPPLAQRALDAARRYAKIAPDSPHALHMPSHIFTRLGLWQESIDSNLVSADSARKNNAPGNELHAKDYLIYAYLQGAQDREAKRALEAPPAGRPDDPQYMNWLYAMGTSPARYVVERHRWTEAAVLTVPPNTFPGGRWAWTEANLHFARALGASHTGNTEAARKDVQQLASLRDTLIQGNDKYWADQVDIQRESAAAWITLAEGKREEAIRQMRAAAEHEDSTDKHNVTPRGHPAGSRTAWRDVAGTQAAGRSDGRVRSDATYGTEPFQRTIRRRARPSFRAITKKRKRTMPGSWPFASMPAETGPNFKTPACSWPRNKLVLALPQVNALAI